MNIRFDAEAISDLTRQLDYLLEQNAPAAAMALEQRILGFIELTLAVHPRVGTFVRHRGLWETWVPRSRIVIWYRFTDRELQFVRLWHTSQDRTRTT